MPLPIIAGGALVALLVNVMRIMLMAKIGAFIVKALAFFGFTWATNKFAVAPAMDFIRDHMATLNGIGGEYGTLMVQWLGVLRFDQAVSMMLSAYAAAWTIKGAKVFLAKQPA
ncbi:hypothetical protein J2X06_002943 [Lysobacter niastensis]|uniref:DUF2523 domain-containing protein n=1 Tax=Lysobacter niastensis TaxID=380629 RepID=A0ABU1WDR4_9GAMM|nr:DUF2523 family protein [Lysobacter niastensis]MDR7135725.1 hypothetical protein [Lysobacter niastensis]